MKPTAGTQHNGNKLNEAWHRKHPMLPHPTLEQRVKWHLAHQKNCGCREMPASVIKYLEEKRKMPK